MEQEATGKRSMALAISLILLVISLIGNVFFMSKYLQHGQDDKVRAGESIYESLVQNRDYFDEMKRQIHELEALAESDGSSARVAAAFIANSANLEGQGLRTTMLYASEQSETTFGQAIETAEAYVAKVHEQLSAIGSQSGPISEQERQWIGGLKATFDEMSAAVGGFYFNIEGNRSAMQRMANGFSWLDVADNMQQKMLEFAEA